METCGVYDEKFKFQNIENFQSSRKSDFQPMFICKDPELAAKYGVPYELCVPDTLGVNYNHIHLVERKDGDYHLPLAIHDSVEYLIQWRLSAFKNSEEEKIKREKDLIYNILLNYKLLKKIILWLGESKK